MLRHLLRIGALTATLFCARPCDAHGEQALLVFAPIALAVTASFVAATFYDVGQIAGEEPGEPEWTIPQVVLAASVRPRA